MADHSGNSQPLPPTFTNQGPGPNSKLSSTARRDQSLRRQLSSFHQPLLPPGPALWPSHLDSEPPLKKRRSNREIRGESVTDVEHQDRSRTGQAGQTRRPSLCCRWGCRQRGRGRLGLSGDTRSAHHVSRGGDRGGNRGGSRGSHQTPSLGRPNFDRERSQGAAGDIVL